MPSLVNEWFYLSSARFLLVKTVQYSSQRRGTPNLHLLSHPLTLRRCNLSNESNCIVCRDAPLEFLNLPWCPSPVTGIAVVPSLTQTFPRQELQCPMTNEIRPLDNRATFIVSEWWFNAVSATEAIFTATPIMLVHVYRSLGPVLLSTRKFTS